MSDQSALDISKHNSGKLDRLIQLIEGTGAHDSGLIGKLDKHELVLFGDMEKPGIVTKVNFMWRLHVWLLCTASGLGGAVFTWIFKK